MTPFNTPLSIFRNQSLVTSNEVLVMSEFLFLAKTQLPYPQSKIWVSYKTRTLHVSTLTSSLIFILCQISKVRHLFSKSVLFTILNCLVFSKLLYCSTVWSGTFKQHIHKLQLVQNFAARVLTNTRKFDHISPVLRELGWSSIKHLLLVRDVTQLYKIVNGLAPSYLNSNNKRTGIHSYNTRFGENLDVPMC